MMTTARPRPCPLQSLLPEAVAPVRSPRASLVPAEADCRRRPERWQRCQGRIRHATWFGLFDCRPFDSICTRATPGAVFFGTAPLVYSLPLF